MGDGTCKYATQRIALDGSTNFRILFRLDMTPSSCLLVNYGAMLLYPYLRVIHVEIFFFFFVFLICQDILGEASWKVSSRLQASGFSLRHMQVGTVFGCGWGCWIVGYVSQIGMGRRPKSSGFVYLQTHSCPWKIIQTALLLFSCVIIWGQRVDYWLPFKNKLYESERSSSGLCGSLLLHAFYFCVSINNLHIIFI